MSSWVSDTRPESEAIVEVVRRSRSTHCAVTQAVRRHDGRVPVRTRVLAPERSRRSTVRPGRRPGCGGSQSGVPRPARTAARLRRLNPSTDQVLTNGCWPWALRLALGDHAASGGRPRAAASVGRSGRWPPGPISTPTSCTSLPAAIRSTSPRCLGRNARSPAIGA